MTNSLWVAEDFVPERGQPCWSNPGLQEVSPVGIELSILRPGLVNQSQEFLILCPGQGVDQVQMELADKGAAEG